MAILLSTLQAKRDALMLDLASAESSIQFEGRKVEKRSIAEIKEALLILDREIEKAGGSAASRTTYAYVKR